MSHLQEFSKKFKFSKENRGDQLLITIAGKKEDVEKLDKKIDAIHVLAADCCAGEGGSCC